MAAKITPLAARLARGDEAAFAELYDACAERLFGYLTRRLGCGHQAADVVQATFVRAVQNRKRFAGVENPAAYLFQMARNEAARAYRKSEQKITQQVSDEQADISASASDQHEMAAVALTKLTPDDREIVELKIYAGLTFQEIAEVVERPAATVATRYRRALESLRPWLERQLR